MGAGAVGGGDGEQIRRVTLEGADLAHVRRQLRSIQLSLEAGLLTLKTATGALSPHLVTDVAQVVDASCYRLSDLADMLT